LFLSRARSPAGAFGVGWEGSRGEDLREEASGAGGRLTAADERAMAETLVHDCEQNKNIVANS
jgi:hypothetical protein